MVAPAYWMFAGIYDRVVERLGYRDPEFAVEALLAAAPSIDGPVLDLGCGTGLAAERLLAHVDVPVDGIDASARMLNVARRKGRYRHLFHADIALPLPVAPGTYAGAICSGLFTHAHVGAEALHPSLDALAPGGVFAFTVYAPVWRSGGFETALRGLRAEGRISVVSTVERRHFSRLAPQKVQVVAVRVN
jgi:predicted TPR repeat methyltransferase